MENKKGVSLIILVVTIIVLSILVSVSITKGFQSINQSKINVFVTEISQIEEIVRSTIELGNKKAYVDNKVITYNQFVNLVKTNYTTVEEQNKVITVVKNEMTENGEATDSTFSKVNIEKLSNNKITNGRGNKGNTDYYYISNKTNRVYYAKGIKVKKEQFFSLTDRINFVSKDDIDVIINENKEMDIDMTDSQNLFKETYEDGKLVLELNDSVKIFFDARFTVGVKPKGAKNFITYTYGDPNMQSVKVALANRKYYITPIGNITDAMLSNAEEIRFSYNSESGFFKRYYVLSKEATEKLDYKKPVIRGNEILSNNSNYKIVKFFGTDNKKITSYYVVEKAKINELGEREELFNTNITDPEILAKEIYTHGKKVEESIKLDPKISEISVVAVDEALNISEVKDFTFNEINNI